MFVPGVQQDRGMRFELWKETYTMFLNVYSGWVSLTENPAVSHKKLFVPDVQHKDQVIFRFINLK